MPVTALKPANRKPHVHVLQIVQMRAAHFQPLLHVLHRAPHAASRMLQWLSEKPARLGRLHFLNLRERALGHDLAAARAGAGTEIDDRIRAPHGVFVMLHDDERISLSLQRFERIQELLIIPRMQPDRRFIQHIKNAAQVRSQLGRQPNPLRFAAAEGFRGAIHRQIIQPHLAHENQALLNLRERCPGKWAVAARET